MTKNPICKYFAHVVVGVAVCAFSAIPRAMAAVNLGSSSWVWQNPLPQGNNLQGITCSSTGGSLNCIAVGDLGTVLLGAGSGGSTINWTGQSQISNTTQTLRAVACAPGGLNSCFAVGDGGTILATWDHEATWTSRSSGTTANLTGISCNTTGTAVNCIAVGGAWFLATNDDGVTWGPPRLIGTTLPLSLAAVSCPDTSTCYAAGNSGGEPVILKTSTGGASWTTTSFPGYAAPLKAISCGSTTDCVAVDVSGNTYSTTNGTIWGSPVPVSSAPGASLYGVTCRDAADCVAVGASGGQAINNLYWTNDTGKRWHGETSGADSALLNGVTCSSSTCVAVGELGEIVTNYPLGNTYTNLQTSVASTTKGLKRVSCVDTNNCWAVGDEGIFTTKDGGTTWASQYSASSLSAISCSSTTTCFAVGGNLVLGTTDGGKTWSSQSMSPNTALSAISCPSTTICFSGGFVAGGQGIIVATVDGGKTWQEKLMFPSSLGVRGIVCTSNTSCIAAGSQGVIVTTFNNTPTNNQWNQVPPLTASNLQDVSCASASICIAVGDSGATLITTDGGHNWSLQPPSTAKYLTGTGCDFDLGCYATTNDGYILSMPMAAGALWNQEAQQDRSLAGLSCAGVSGEDRCVAVGDGGTIVSKSIGPSSPDFSLDLQQLSTGKSFVSGFNVIVRALGPFTGTVTLACNIPSGQSCTLNPPSVAGNGTSLMTGPTDLSVWNGATVTGTSGSLKHAVTYVYNPPVPPPPCKPGVCQ